MSGTYLSRGRRFERNAGGLARFCSNHTGRRYSPALPPPEGDHMHTIYLSIAGLISELQRSYNLNAPIRT